MPQEPARPTGAHRPICVLGVGWALGGDVRLGMVPYAVSIGPIVQSTLPFFKAIASGGPGGRSTGAEMAPSRRPADQPPSRARRPVSDRRAAQPRRDAR